MDAILAPVHGEDEAEQGMKLFSGRERVRRKAAADLYAAAATAARRPALYVSYGVPDTLDGRFEMVTLHLFALTHRLMHDPGDDPELARLVAESFVADMDGAFREMGVGDMSVPKRMKALYGSFAGRINAYAAALRQGEGALAAALARNVFPGSVEGGGTLALAAHLKASVAALKKAALADLRGGKVDFPDPRPVPQEEVRP